jgi:hypothetical protein
MQIKLCMLENTGRIKIYNFPFTRIQEDNDIYSDVFSSAINERKRQRGIQKSKDRLHCLHPVVYHDWWYLAVNTTIKINQSNCSHWFYLIAATCLGPHLGPSLGSLIKYVSCYWTVLIWIHISTTYHTHTGTRNSYNINAPQKKYTVNHKEKTKPRQHIREVRTN